MASFLVVRLGAIGDIVHALPLAAALRRNWPDARIHWAVERRHAELFGLVVGLDAVLPLDSRQVLGRDGWLRSARRMRRVGYDVVFDAQGLLKSALVARLAGGARTIGFAPRALREPAARFLYSECVDPVGAAHVIDKNLSLMRAVGIEAAPRAFPLRDVPPSPAVAEAIAASSGPYVLLNPGGGWPNKRWPAARFGALAVCVRERRGLSSLVLWGPGDETIADEVVTHGGGAARRAPATRLADVVALARGAAVMVSGDTGPAHLAAAAGTPLVGIFGPTDPVRNGPFESADVNVSRHHVCECYHLRRCRSTRWCLDDVAVEEVLAAVERRLATATAGRCAGRS